AFPGLAPACGFCFVSRRVLSAPTSRGRLQVHIYPFGAAHLLAAMWCVQSRLLVYATFAPAEPCIDRLVLCFPRAIEFALRPAHDLVDDSTCLFRDLFIKKWGK
ncbi:unnamed protein product, partial [Laminaria digitata]